MLSKPTPTLRGIPTELRLQIYNELLSADLNCPILEGYHQGWDTNTGYSTQAIRVPDAKLNIPWLALMATCKPIRTELHSHMQDSKTAYDKSTYTLDMELHHDVGKTTWRHLPCAPNDARVLEVNCYPENRTMQPWGDGGPMNVARSLYQLLNAILHCGPRLDHKTPLNEHMRLREVVVYVHYPFERREEDRAPLGEVLDSLDWLLQRVQSTSILHGYVDQVKFVGDGAERIRVQHTGEGRGIPKEWDRYGFEWGVLGQE